MAKRAAIRLPQSETQTATDLCHFYVEFLAGRGFNEREFSSFNPPFCGESFGISASLVRKWKSKAWKFGNENFVETFPTRISLFSNIWKRNEIKIARLKYNWTRAYFCACLVEMENY